MTATEMGWCWRMSLSENFALKGAGAASRNHHAGARSRRRLERSLREFDVRPQRRRRAAGSLSGGNQQKFILGRELHGPPPALVVENPTRGLDVRASRYTFVIDWLDACANGVAIVMHSRISTRLLAIAHRMLVVYAGVVREVPRRRGPGWSSNAWRRVTTADRPHARECQLALLALAMVLGMTPWFSATVAAPGMIAEWSTTPSTSAWLTIAVQLGFVLGTFVSAVLLLSDRFSARRLAAVSSFVVSSRDGDACVAPYWSRASDTPSCCNRCCPRWRLPPGDQRSQRGGGRSGAALPLASWLAH